MSLLYGAYFRWAQGRRLLTVAVSFILVSFLILTPCHGIESYVAWPAIDPDSQSVLEAAGKFLGVELKTVRTYEDLEAGWGGNEPSSLMIVSDAFIASLDSDARQRFQDAIVSSGVHPMIVMDRSEPHGSQPFLDGLGKYVIGNTSGVLHFSAKHAEILKELSGLKIPVAFEEKSVFLNIGKQGSGDAEPLIWMEDPDGGRHVVMAVRRAGQGRLYLAAFPKCRITKGNETFIDLPKVLPILIFFKQEGREFCWHRKAITANLTIDDPWLVEPYGNLSYKALLEQMEKVNFHTTIAFVPWNYDRSHKEVVDLFLKHPGRYSIAFHGNNHDRQEFGNYKDHPFVIQETCIRQAVARMDKFSRLTGIPVSPVMIFPHGIAPEKSVLALQKNNFVATVNSRILPLGDEGPVGIDAMLWPVNLNYGGFPVMQRFNPRVEKTTINIMLFLEKPLLFYTHQDYFYKNIEAFNEVVEYVNQQTGGRARWVDLEQVCNELYMERWRADGGRDIRMIARSVSPINSTATSAHYHIKENLTGCQDLGELELGTAAYTMEFEHLLGMQTTLKPGKK